MSRYKVYSEQVTNQGILSLKGAKVRFAHRSVAKVGSRYKVIGHLLRAGTNRKKYDKLMHFIVRVSNRRVL